MTIRKIADSTAPCATTWTLDEDALSVTFRAIGARYVKADSVGYALQGVGGDESTFTFNAVPFTGPALRPDSPGAFAWAAEQVTAWCAANGWGGRCVAVRVGDAEVLKLESEPEPQRHAPERR